MKNALVYIGFFSIVLLITFLSACSGSQLSSTPTEDTRYLTPIPQATLDAFIATLTAPITTKMQAVIAARRELLATRLEFSNPPSVLFVEEMKLVDALQRAGQSDKINSPGKPSNTKVWLVIFIGDVQIIPPDPMHTLTPAPPSTGCATVIINSDTGLSEGVRGTACPKFP